MARDIPAFRVAALLLAHHTDTSDMVVRARHEHCSRGAAGARRVICTTFSMGLIRDMGVKRTVREARSILGERVEVGSPDLTAETADVTVSKVYGSVLALVILAVHG